MKKIYGMLMMAAMTALPSMAYEGETFKYAKEGSMDSVTFMITDEQAKEVQAGNNYGVCVNPYTASKIEIPETVEYNGETYAVTRIGDWAFYLCAELETIDLNGGKIKEIGDYAFYGCKALKNVSVGDAVSSVGYGSFLGCDNLAEFTTKAQTPPTLISNDAFERNNTNCLLKTEPASSAVMNAYLAQITDNEKVWDEWFYTEQKPTVWYSMGFNEPKETYLYETLDSASTEADVQGMNGVYVVKDSIYINSRMRVDGTAYIVIVDDAALYANKGITVTEGNTLYICHGSYSKDSIYVDKGEVLAIGDGRNAGIGGEYDEVLETEQNAAGNIYIYNQYVDASGVESNDDTTNVTSYSAAVGGCLHGDGGNVIVEGRNATLDAFSAYTKDGDGNLVEANALGAGIGGGAYGDGGTLTVNVPLYETTEDGDTSLHPAVIAFGTYKGSCLGSAIGGGTMGAGGDVIVKKGFILASSVYESDSDQGSGIGASPSYEGDSSGSLTVESDEFSIFAYAQSGYPLNLDYVNVAYTGSEDSLAYLKVADADEQTLYEKYEKTISLDGESSTWDNAYRVEIKVAPASAASIRELDVETKSSADSPVYDLTGRRLNSAPDRGVYLKGGKKFIAR